MLIYLVKYSFYIQKQNDDMNIPNKASYFFLPTKRKMLSKNIMDIDTPTIIKYHKNIMDQTYV